MTYLLILGLLALAGCFTLCWGLWCLTRWGLARIWPQRVKVARKAKTLQTPWRLTRGLALLRGSLPLGILTILLHGGARLAAHGMASVDQAVPVGFSQIISALGWSAVLLLVLSAVGQWASWRCRGV